MSAPWYQDPAIVVAAIAAVVASLSAVFTLAQAIEARRTRLASERASREQSAQAQKAVKASLRSARAAENSAYVAKQGMETSQRCWVVVKELKQLFPEMNTGVPSHVRVVIKNSGPTPANIINLELFCRLQEMFSVLYIQEKAVKHAPGIVGPGQTFEMMVKVDTDGFNDAMYLLGMAKVSVWGTIDYADIFEHRHHTMFGYVYGVMSAQFEATAIHNSLWDLADPQSEETA